MAATESISGEPEGDKVAPEGAKPPIRTRAKTFVLRFALALVFLPIITVAILNLWFLLGARTGLGDWTAIQARLTAGRDPSLEPKRLEVYLGLLAIADEPKTAATLTSIGKLYRKSGSENHDYNTSKKGQTELALLQSVCQKKCLPLLETLNPKGFTFPQKAETGPARQVLYLITCAARTEILNLAVAGDDSARERLEIYLKHLGNFSGDEPMNILQERIWYLEYLGATVRGLVHTSQLDPKFFKKLETLFGSLPPIPDDIIVSASDQFFERSRFSEIFSHWIFVPFPLFEDFVWRSNLQVYLKVRPQLKDFHDKVSLEKMYQHHLDNTGKYIGWATPHATINGHHFFKSFQNEMASTLIVLELEDVWTRTGHYPKQLSELESADFTLPSDPFNKDGFEYQRDLALDSFSLKSLSNWHEEGQITYHQAHQALNRQVAVKPSEPKP